ncbi:tetratricopeptide repeat protein [Mucilaginibacter lappiensis]|uniref:tetratricopeptide repeat protein n=1 Tax=Mucilaginibacter lappiensis TaxID=354630 RepID=UPI003D26392C
MNSIFYKYRSDCPFTEQIITSRQVYLSTAEGLNDPFECSLQDIGKEWIQEQVLQMKQAALSGFVVEASRSLKAGEHFFGLTTSETTQMLEKIRNMKDINEIFSYREQIVKDQTGYPPSNPDKIFAKIDEQLLAVGIFSLSVNPDHQAMWAHYGGEDKGICLGFKNTPGSKFSNPDHFLPVAYSDTLPEMGKGFNAEMTFSMGENGVPYASNYKIAFSDKTFQKAISTKPTCWMQEEEWRYVESYPGLFDWPGPLTEIIFGLKCNKERRNYYIDLVEANIPYPVDFYEIRKIHGTNKVEKVEYEVKRSNPKISSFPAESLTDGKRETPAADFVARMDGLLHQGNYGEVLFQVEKNLENHPDDTILQSLKGTAFGMSQKHDKALECFKKIIDIDPDIAQAWYQAGCALIALNRNEEAVDAFRKAYELDSNDSSTAYNLGVMLHATEQLSEALKYLRIAVQLGHRRAHRAILDVESDISSQ